MEMSIVQNENPTKQNEEYNRRIWKTVCDQLRGLEWMSESLYTLWFSDLSLAYIIPGYAVITNASDFKRDIIVKKYGELLRGLLGDAAGGPLSLDIRSTQNGALSFTGEKPDIPITPEEASREVAKAEAESKFAADLSNDIGVMAKIVTKSEPSFFSTVGDSMVLNYASVYKAYSFRYTFDTFIVGGSNKFAHAACTAVANNPARDYNPLFVYGPSGLGKTHLLYAITDQISRQRPDMNILYVKGEDFTNQMIDSISKGLTAEFRERYRKTDVLLIDDIQFIAGKEATQEEFFHTFNALYEEHKQIILTSDRPPRDIKQLEDRLRSRFEWGLIADIQPPDMELRVAILKNKAQAIGLTIPPEVLTYIAENLRDNVRQLEGAVKKISAQCFLSGREVTHDLALSCIADMISGSEPVSVTIERINECVANHYGVDAEELKGRKRTSKVAAARHVAIYIVRTLTDMSLPAIGRVYNRDHTTVLSSLDKVEADIKSSTLVELEIKELIREIKE